MPSLMRKMSTGLPRHLLPAMKNQPRRRRKNTDLQRHPLILTLNQLLPLTMHQLLPTNLNLNTSPNHHTMQNLSLIIGQNQGLLTDQNPSQPTDPGNPLTSQNLNTNKNPSINPNPSTNKNRSINQSPNINLNHITSQNPLIMPQNPHTNQLHPPMRRRRSRLMMHHHQHLNLPMRNQSRMRNISTAPLKPQLRAMRNLQKRRRRNMGLPRPLHLPTRNQQTFPYMRKKSNQLHTLPKMNIDLLTATPRVLMTFQSSLCLFFPT